MTEPEYLREVLPQQRLLLDDGRIQLVALGHEGDRLRTRVTVGGKLLPNKGVNLPDTKLSIPALTDRDHQSLQVAAEAKVDWLALSFVRHASAADELRQAARAAAQAIPIWPPQRDCCGTWPSAALASSRSAFPIAIPLRMAPSSRRLTRAL